MYARSSLGFFALILLHSLWPSYSQYCPVPLEASEEKTAKKMEMELELKSSADKFWKAIRNTDAVFPKIFPEQYKSIEVVEGDGKSVGTVRLLKYGEALAPIFTFAKEKVEVADEENKRYGYSIIAGEMLNYYKVFKITIQVIPKGEGCVVEGILEYEKASDQIPEPDNVKEMAERTFKGLDAYILKD